MIPRPHLRTLLVASSAALLIGVTAACSSDDDPTSTPTTEASEPTATATLETSATTEATTAAPAEATATSEATTTAPADTLSANDASIEELTTAFEAAGISNASVWAREVDEYRPYSADDADYAKLRGELAKYNPGPGVVDAIIATLHLP